MIRLFYFPQFISPQAWTYIENNGNVTHELITLVLEKSNRGRKEGTMNRIRECRLQRGMLQKELAAELRCKQPELSCWELGKNEPDAGSARRISAFFGVSPSYLLGKTDDPTPEGERAFIQQKKYMRFVQEYEKLSPEMRTMAIGAVKSVLTTADSDDLLCLYEKLDSVKQKATRVIIHGLLEVDQEQRALQEEAS